MFAEVEHRRNFGANETGMASRCARNRFRYCEFADWFVYLALVNARIIALHVAMCEGVDCWGWRPSRDRRSLFELQMYHSAISAREVEIRCVVEYCILNIAFAGDFTAS